VLLAHTSAQNATRVSISASEEFFGAVECDNLHRKGSRNLTRAHGCSLVQFAARLENYGVVVQDLGSSSALLMRQFERQNAALRPFPPLMHILTSLTCPTRPMVVLHIYRGQFAHLNDFFPHMPPNPRVMFSLSTYTPTPIRKPRYGPSLDYFASHVRHKPSLIRPIVLVCVFLFA
jgi:hypothetical protein